MAVARSQISEPCAGTNTVAALLAGAIDGDAARGLEAHLDRCPSCRRVIGDLGRGLTAIGEAPGSDGPLPQLGERVGRYELVRLLGVGGMGVVYEAHDAALGRRVAVKLLRPDLSARAGDALLAEAQAMARLHHANVVVVHDIGRHGRQLYVCMEYVAGTTLRGWLERARPWREIVDALVIAGRGLAYVHAAGLVHRDFKPDNVLVGSDGRIVVSDFGLAQVIDRVEHGFVVGTPAYMAPEQRRGESVDARADQYAFCVTLAEAVGRRGPRWLRRICARGSAAAPRARFASMTALLAAIDRRRVPRRWPHARLALVPTIAMLAGLYVLVAASTPVAPITRVVDRPIDRPIDRAVGAPWAHAPLFASADRDDHDRDVTRHDTRDDDPRDATHAAARAAACATCATEPIAASLAVMSSAPPALPAAPAAFAVAASAAAAFAPSCDDASELTCGRESPACPATTVAAIERGCWTCADEATCAPLGIPASCGDGTRLTCGLPQPLCSGHEIATIDRGCWRCADPFSCGNPTGSGSGTRTSSGSGSDEPPEGSNAVPASCGNGFCEAGETHENCPQDCCVSDGSGGCAAVCGNGFCEAGETHQSCPQDCND